MRTSEAFAVVKARMATDRGSVGEFYVCHAIKFTRGKLDYDAETRLLRIIEDLLEGEYTLETWLKRRHLKTKRSFHTEPDRARMLATRHAWLDHLIEHYKSIGD